MQGQSSSKLQLVLGTGAFALCFALFGSMSAMMPIISKHMALTPVQKSVAIAVPVLLGSLGRIPLGILTDRFGGRTVFSLVMAFSIIPAFLMGGVSTYTQLLSYGFFIGVALASFSVGVAFVNGWYPPERQAPWSLAWSILALAAHRRPIASLHDSLSALSNLSSLEDTGTLALTCLALDYSRALSAFEVTG